MGRVLGGNILHIAGSGSGPRLWATSSPDSKYTAHPIGNERKIKRSDSVKYQSRAIVGGNEKNRPNIRKRRRRIRWRVRASGEITIRSCHTRPTHTAITLRMGARTACDRHPYRGPFWRPRFLRYLALNDSRKDVISNARPSAEYVGDASDQHKKREAIRAVTWK